MKSLVLFFIFFASHSALSIENEDLLSCEIENENILGENYENLVALSTFSPPNVSETCSSMKIPTEKIFNLGSARIENSANDFYKTEACASFGSTESGACRTYAKLMYQELYYLYRKRENLVSQYKANGFSEDQAKQKANQVVRFFSNDINGISNACPKFNSLSDQKKNGVLGNYHGSHD